MTAGGQVAGERPRTNVGQPGKLTLADEAGLVVVVDHRDEKLF